MALYFHTPTTQSYWRYVLPFILLVALTFMFFLSSSVTAQSDRPEQLETLAMSSEMPIDINVATAEQLATALVGIGPAKADDIVTYRNQHGSFSSVDELLNIKGIGRKTLERNRGLLTVQ